MTPLPILTEPGARFDCRKCGACCRRAVGVPLEMDDVDRLQPQAWASGKHAIPGGVLVPKRDFYEADRLRVVDGACVFLDAEGLCKVELRFGHAAKPLRCRLFPFRVAALPHAVQVSVSPECRSLHESFLEGTPLEEAKGLAELVEAAPRLFVVGQAFRLRFGVPPALPFEDVYAYIEDAAAAAMGVEPLEDMPRAVRRAVLRLMGEEPPKTPWDFEGPPEVPFYQALDHLGEALEPTARKAGLPLAGTCFSSLRRWLAWVDAARALTPEAAAFLRTIFRALCYEMRAVQLGQVVGGLGAVLYVTMAAAAGAARIAEVRRQAQSITPGDLNEAAKEVSEYLRHPTGLAALEDNILALERLIFDAPPSVARPELRPS